MMTSWLFLAAAVMGQVQTTQPADEPADRAPAPKIRVVLPPATQPEEAVSVVMTRPAPGQAFSTTTLPAPGGLSGGPVSVQATETGIVITGSPEDIEFLQGIIRMMETAPNMTFQIFPLQYATAKDLAQSMQQLWSDAKKTATGRVSPEDRLTVIPEARANVLMVATTPQNMEEVGKIVKQLDQPALGSTVKFVPIPLKNINAVEAQQKLGDLLKTLQQQRKIDTALFNINADVRTNSLLVAAPEADLEQIRELVKIIDVPPTLEAGGIAKVAIFPLQKAVSKDLAKSLTDMLRANTEAGKAATEQIRRLQVALRKAGGDERELPELDLEKPINIQSEDGTNSIVVQSTEKNLKSIGEIIRVLDSVPLADEMMVKMFPLKFADAETLQGNLDKLFSAGQQLPDQPGKTVPGRIPPGLPGAALAYPVALSADTRTNTLIVAGRPEQVYLATQIITGIDVAEHANRFPPRLIKLEHASVEKMQTAVENLAKLREQMAEKLSPTEQARERILVIPDQRTESLIVIASDENFQEITEMVAKLDTAAGDYLGEVHIINLKDPLLAADVAKKIDDLWKRQAEQRQQAGVPADQPRVVADTRSNALIIAAAKEDFVAIQNLVKQLQAMPAESDARFVQLKNSDVVNVASKLTDMFEGISKSMGEQGNQYQLQIIPNTRTNTLILTGSPMALARAEQLIPMLDQPAEVGAAYETRVYKLQQGSAAQLAPIIEDLLKGQTTEEQAGARTPTVVIPDAASNSLIISASREAQADLARLIEKLDIPSQLSQQMQVITLTKAKATAVSETLQDLVQAQQAQGQGGQQGFSVTADERTNSLVVFAPPDLMATIQDIVRRLDRAEPGSVLAMRVFRLENAVADTLAKELNEFFKAAGAGEAQGKDMRQLVIRFFPVNPESNQPIFDPATGERIVKTLVYQDITIAPDPYTNSLLVLAPSDHIDMMEMLIRMLDSIEPRAAKIDAYQLRNADAQEMADLLKELFKPAQGGGQGEQGRTLVIAGEGGAAGAGAGPGGGTAGSEIEIAFSIDRRTNTLIAAGTPAQLKIVESLVYRLDDEPIDERVVRVVPLQYAKSDDVSKTLTSFFENESSLLEKAEEGTAAMRQLQRQVTIESGGETSNLLLVSYSPRLESQIVTMINELDRPPPQVMIQVLMAEVTLDDRFELGMEFALQDLLFSEHAFVGGNGTIQGDNFDFIGGTDLGAAGSGLGGVSFTVTGEDFNFLVRALQTEGRLEVLSRPSLLVQDNQEASIKVGERVPVVQELAVTGTGTVTPSVNYEDVGVNLEVTPIINPDGFVNLEIAPEISALGVSSVSIGTGITLPTFTQRKAETSVTVKDGETIIIGGLITSRDSETENKVPVLGDIPLLGLAFRATVKSQTKTELLMVLTPHVIRNPEEARTISVQMRDQTGLIDDVRKNPLMQGLQIKPEDDQLGPMEPVPVPAPLAPPPKEMGPELQELGPPTTSIEFGPNRDSIAVRN